MFMKDHLDLGSQYKLCKWGISVGETGRILFFF